MIATATQEATPVWGSCCRASRAAASTNREVCPCLGAQSDRDGSAARRRPLDGRQADDSVVIKTQIGFLVENKCGGRFTIVEAAPAEGWAPYTKMVSELSARHKGLRFETLDLTTAPSAATPPLRPNRTKPYPVAKIITQCDKLISVAPLKTDKTTGVALTFSNYLGIAPAAKLDDPAEGLVDLFSYHPADYCILGGPVAAEGDGTRVRHNLLVSGTKAASVDAVAATLMGFKIDEVPHLKKAADEGFGSVDLDEIWTRGNEMEEAKKAFRR